MVSLSCARKGEPQGNLFTLHYPTGAPSELINFPDYITCILKAHRNLECNDFVPNSNSEIQIFNSQVWALCRTQKRCNFSGAPNDAQTYVLRFAGDISAKPAENFAICTLRFEQAALFRDCIRNWHCGHDAL